MTRLALKEPRVHVFRQFAGRKCVLIQPAHVDVALGKDARPYPGAAQRTGSFNPFDLGGSAHPFESYTAPSFFSSDRTAGRTSPSRMMLRRKKWGRRFTSSMILAMYSPTMLKANRFSEPKNRMASSTVVRPLGTADGNNTRAAIWMNMVASVIPNKTRPVTLRTVR